MNAPLTSTSFPRGAEVTRSEADARAALAKYPAPSLSMPLRLPAIKSCPDCGMTPAIDPAFHGEVCIYCDNDDCSQISGDGWPQAMGVTLEVAAEKWNALVRA